MLAKTRGIVLHVTPYSETSIVAKIYTEHFGLKSFIAGSVRSKKSKFSITSFQSLSLVELVAYSIEKPGMRRISDIRLAEAFTSIPFHIVKSTVALFLKEVIMRSLKEEESNPALFSFLFNSILILDLRTPDCSQFHLFFLIQLSKYLGFYPLGSYGNATPYFDLAEGKFTSTLPPHSGFLEGEEAIIFYKLMQSSFETHHAIEVSPAQRRALIHSLVKYYELHQTHGVKIQSHLVLEELG